MGQFFEACFRAPKIAAIGAFWPCKRRQGRRHRTGGWVECGRFFIDGCIVDARETVGREKVTATFCRDGPSGASHKRWLSPFLGLIAPPVPKEFRGDGNRPKDSESDHRPPERHHITSSYGQRYLVYASRHGQIGPPHWSHSLVGHATIQSQTGSHSPSVTIDSRSCLAWLTGV